MVHGRHILMEMWGCDEEALNDVSLISDLMFEAAAVSNSTPIRWVTHQFHPQGVTGFMLVEESHFAIHTWPEDGYAAIDAFTCGKRCEPLRSVEVFRQGLRAAKVDVREVARGVSEK